MALQVTHNIADPVMKGTAEVEKAKNPDKNRQAVCIFRKGPGQ